VGTALVFGDNGEFIGALNATLGAPQEVKPNPLGQGLSDPARFPNIIGVGPKVGPSQLTVAYTTGAQIVKRVLNGFRSESHVVEYPTLGVMCTDAAGNQGALIQTVVPNSPAARGGLRPGDIIVDIEGGTIRNQIDFARVMLEQEVGKEITVRIRRGKDLMFLKTNVAKATE
jgi:S1-C subfamily serine protease